MVCLFTSCCTIGIRFDYCWRSLCFAFTNLSICRVCYGFSLTHPNLEDAALHLVITQRQSPYVGEPTVLASLGMFHTSNISPISDENK